MACAMEKISSAAVVNHPIDNFPGAQLLSRNGSETKTNSDGPSRAKPVGEQHAALKTQDAHWRLRGRKTRPIDWRRSWRRSSPVRILRRRSRLGPARVSGSPAGRAGRWLCGHLDLGPQVRSCKPAHLRTLLPKQRWPLPQTRRCARRSRPLGRRPRTIRGASPS